MSKKLLSEQVVNRWAKLSGVKLNEMYGSPVGERDDGMGMGEEMPPEGDTGIEMADEAPMDDMGGAGEESITVEDDKLEAMLAGIIEPAVEKAVQAALEKMGLGDAGDGDEGGDEAAGPDTEDMEDPMDDEEGSEDEEALDEELEIVSDDEIINETLKRVVKRLVG